MRHELADAPSVRRVVREARAAGLDRLVVQVRGRGDAWYETALVPRASQLEPGFDPLALLIEEAAAAELEVHAWVNLLLVASGARTPESPRHIAREHPEWLDRRARQAQWPSDEELLSRLLRDAAARGDIEGAYLDPGHPAVRSRLVAVVLDLASRYSLSGLHFDYIRHAGREHGCSPRSLRAFGAARGRSTVEGGLARRRREPRAWEEHRRARLDRLVATLSSSLRRLDPELLISAAVRPSPRAARDRVSQDWGRWLEEGWIDVACPMNYAADRREFSRHLRLLPHAARIWMGIGLWRLDPAEAFDRIRNVESRGAAEAILLFSHASLRERPELAERLARSARR